MPEDQFRLQTRDLYIPAGDIGMWQGALRDRNDPTYQAVAAAIDNRETVTVELLYSDQVGGQRTISRFGLIPYEREGEDGGTRLEWFANINRHWYLDRAGPRSDEQVVAASQRRAARARDGRRARACGGPGRRREETTEEDVAAGESATNGSEASPPEPVAVIPRPNCE